MKEIKADVQYRENLEKQLPWIWLEFGQMYFKVQNILKEDHGHGQEWLLVTPNTSRGSQEDREGNAS